MDLLTSPQLTRQCLTTGPLATGPFHQEHALCLLLITSLSRYAAAAVWARPGEMDVIDVLCQVQVMSFWRFCYITFCCLKTYLSSFCFTVIAKKRIAG